jgi:hypothetical protein
MPWVARRPWTTSRSGVAPTMPTRPSSSTARAKAVRGLQESRAGAAGAKRGANSFRNRLGWGVDAAQGGLPAEVLLAAVPDRRGDSGATPGRHRGRSTSLQGRSIVRW